MKPRILFIARNIPSPAEPGINDIIFSLGSQLMQHFSVKFLYPKEIVPFFLKSNPRYAKIARLKPWTHGEFLVQLYRYYRIPMKSRAFVLLRKLSKEGKQYLRDEGPFDLIHAHYGLPDGYIAMLMSKWLGIPYLISVRATDTNFILKFRDQPGLLHRYQKVLSNASGIIVHNAAHRSLIKSVFQLDSVLTPHGIDLATNKPTFKEEVSDKPIIVLVVAVMIPRKKHRWVIDAIKHYTGPKTVELRLIGEGELLEELKSYSSDPRVSFLGKLPQQEVFNEMESSDIFALPSTGETLGLVYLEAATRGNAIICKRDEGVFGLFQPDAEVKFIDDFEDFQQQLHLLIDDESLRQQLAVAARQKVKNYSWPRIVDRYQELYSKVLGPGNSELETKTN